MDAKRGLGRNPAELVLTCGVNDVKVESDPSIFHEEAVSVACHHSRLVILGKAFAEQALENAALACDIGKSTLRTNLHESAAARRPDPCAASATNGFPIPVEAVAT